MKQGPHLAKKKNFCLIHPILQIWPHAISFFSKHEKMAWWTAYFAAFDKPYFLDGLKKLEYRWTKCIELKGDYIEKLI